MRVAITGGIGSGKSHVCGILLTRGIAVYDCDEAAKRLMNEHVPLRRKIQDLVGEEAYMDGVLNKALMAQFILNNAGNAQKVNDIVHPVVADDFMASQYTWLESAIYFDSGFDKRVKIDKVVCVVAPEALRISRIMCRDGISEAKAKDWIGCQLPQEELISRSDYVLLNDGKHDIESQIDKLLKDIQQ